MMSKVLVVDDSIVFRKILIESLSNQRCIRVLEACSNGKDALVKIRQLKPDVVVLDVEMPEMDGMQTLQEIKRQKLDVGVIMFSGLTQEGAQITFDALSKGAFDFVPKPSGSGNFYESVQKTRRELTDRITAYMETKSSFVQIKRPAQPPPLIKQLEPEEQKQQEEMPLKNINTPVQQPLSPRQEIPQTQKIMTPPRHNIIKIPKQPSESPAAKIAAQKTVDRPRPAPKVFFPGKIEAVGIGISTGGPNALNEMIPKIPSSFTVPVFIVQHMPPVFTTQLAKRLDEKSPLKVVEAQDNMPVEPATVYLAPGDFHMTVSIVNSQKIIKLNQDAPENSCRPAVDVLFRSLASVYGSRALAVIMTGMGQDGLKGAVLMKEKGAYIFAQDKETSVVWGMPRFVTEAGLADKICPLSDIANCILQISGVLTR